MFSFVIKVNLFMYYVIFIKLLKNVVFWDVRVTRIGELGATLAATSTRRTLPCVLGSS
jgi:Na+/glutamate symporter